LEIGSPSDILLWRLPQQKYHRIMMTERGALRSLVIF